MATELVEIQQEMNRKPDEEVFENYGVFQSDYEFKFVQEGTDKTTLMLPTVTQTSMDVDQFNIEIEVDPLLLVDKLEMIKTNRNTIRYRLKISKGKTVQTSPGLETVSQLSDKTLDVHNYSKSQVVTNPPAEGDNQIVKVMQIIGADGKSSTVCVKTKDEALDGTELSSEIGNNDDLDDDYNNDGDDDDDFDGADMSDVIRTLTDGSPSDNDKPRRKYERTNCYSAKKSDLFSRKQTEEGNTMFQCNSCSYTSKWVGNMRDHVRTHTGEKPFVCNICYKAFTNQSSYNNHVVIHKEARPFVCKICGYAFKVKRQLVKHELRHTTQGQYKCEYCNRLYYTNTELKNHLPVHTRERKHKCDLCYKAFTSVSSLSRHKLLHTGGNYQCHLCASTFLRKETWRRHMIRSHDYDENDALLSKRIRYTSVKPDMLDMEGVEEQQVISLTPENTTVDTTQVTSNMEAVQTTDTGEVQYIISLSY
ncbi:hypothetical protein ACF0H5_012150 [Mactra antiquata]